MPAVSHLVYYFTYASVDDVNSEIVKRRMTVIYGVPFYCSSGINSKHQGTWFPFFGLNTRGVYYHECGSGKCKVDEVIGWFRKPSGGLTNDIRPFCGNDREKNKLFTRFGSIKAILISAALGGGFWESEFGLKFAQDLRKEYEVFFDNNHLILRDTWKIIIQPQLVYNGPEITWMSKFEYKAAIFVVNKILASGDPDKFSGTFDYKDWIVVFNDLTPLLTNSTKPLSFKLWQPTITDYLIKTQLETSPTLLTVANSKRMLDEIPSNKRDVVNEHNHKKLENPSITFKPQ